MTYSFNFIFGDFNYKLSSKILVKKKSPYQNMPLLKVVGNFLLIPNISSTSLYIKYLLRYKKMNWDWFMKFKLWVNGPVPGAHNSHYGAVNNGLIKCLLDYPIYNFNISPTHCENFREITQTDFLALVQVNWGQIDIHLRSNVAWDNW